MSRFEIDERVSDALDWPDMLRHLADRCHTDPGREAALVMPWLETAEEVEKTLDLVSETRACHDQGEPLPFGSVWDLREALSRLEKEGMLDGEILVQIAQTLVAGSRLRRFLGRRAEQAPGLARLGGKLSALDDVSGPITDSFDERGALVDHASPDLKRLRRKVIDLHDQLTRRMKTLMEEPRISKFLQDTYYTQREDRYVLPIRTDAGSAVKGIVHGSSSSGVTLFVEPQEMVSQNNELKVAEMEVAREEARIYSELSALVSEEIPAIRSNLDLMRRLDLLDARARLAMDLGAHRPRISQDGAVKLQAIRHPLMLLAGMEVVANDLELSGGQTMIITGPNAGGKTVTLKTLGLFSLMLRAGMHLPAGPDSRLPLHDAMVTEMGDDQSIEQNLSTFTAHLTHLLDFLETARRGMLILLDEIAIGTDPGEGAALAQALLEAFAESGAQVVVTTHYERLKSLPVTEDRFANASVGFDMEAMRPTYRLHQGTPGRSGALDVARRLGLAPALADRAAELLEHGGQELSELLAALSGERTRLEEQHEELTRATEEARRLADDHRARLERLERREKEAVAGAFNTAIEELKRARQELDRVRSLLKGKPSKDRVKQAERQISTAARAIQQHEPRRESIGNPARVEELSPGTRVLIKRLGGEGEVIEPPARGKVMVRVGSIRTKVALSDVLLSRKKKQKPRGERPAADRRQTKGPAPREELAAGRAPVRTAYNTMDLRGFRVDEALAETDRFLDQALRAEEPVLMIIHGHGTGALKAALREHLATLDLVDRCAAAPPEDGGDGVTVIWLA